jgi:hemolysin activation/secretion protein
VTPARNLPSDELFQIGGATSVRGYQQGVVAGDGGYYGDLQLNHTLDWALKGLAGYVFADAGRVTTVSPQPKGIYGTGVGLSWNGWEYLSTDLSVGVPLAKINGQNDYRIYGRVVLHVL